MALDNSHQVSPLCGDVLGVTLRSVGGQQGDLAFVYHPPSLLAPGVPHSLLLLCRYISLLPYRFLLCSFHTWV